MNLVFIVGLPGSGKTTLAKERYLDYILIDDPRTKPVFDSNLNYVITDPHLCKPSVFNVVKRLYPDAYYILFTNNPIQCLINLSNRLDARIITEDYLYKLSQLYTPELIEVNNKEIVEVYHG